MAKLTRVEEDGIKEIIREVEKMTTPERYKLLYIAAGMNFATQIKDGTYDGRTSNKDLQGVG